MLKTIDYARLSGKVYRPFRKSYLGLTVTSFTRGAVPPANGWVIAEDVDSFVNPGHHFYAALYLKFRSGQAMDAVVAIRGTRIHWDRWNNAIVDIESWQSDVLGNGKHDEVPTYYIKALQFFKKSRKYVEQYFPKARLSITGHSLGGALAQLIAGIGHRTRPVVTFNSPGNGDIPGIDDNMASYVTGFNSRYGFINKIGKPFGKVNYVDVPNEETAAKDFFKAYHDEQTAVKDKTLNLNQLNKRLKSDMTKMQNDFLLACGAQHSINNLIAALHNDPNLANHTIM